MPDNEAQPLEDRNRDQGAPSLGRILRSAREAQGLTLEQICAELRFEQHLLEALEDDRFEELGPPVFAKGYVKHYGQRLGLSYEDLAERYHDAVGSEEVVIEPNRPIRLRDERQITVWVVAAVALLVIGVLLFLWWINDLGASAALRQPGEPTPAATAPPVVRGGAGTATRSPGPEPDRAGVGAGASPGAERAGAAIAARAAPDAEDGAPLPEIDRAESPPGVRPASPGAEPSAADPRAPTADVAPPAASVDNGAPQPAAGEVSLELVFTEDSWTEVRAADGERLVYGLMRTGQRRRVVGEAPLRVLLGNAGGVRIAVGDAPFTIPAAARRGDLAEFTVSGSEN